MSHKGVAVPLGELMPQLETDRGTCCLSWRILPSTLTRLFVRVAAELQLGCPRIRTRRLFVCVRRFAQASWPRTHRRRPCGRSAPHVHEHGLSGGQIGHLASDGRPDACRPLERGSYCMRLGEACSVSGRADERSGGQSSGGWVVGWMDGRADGRTDDRRVVGWKDSRAVGRSGGVAVGRSGARAAGLAGARSGGRSSRRAGVVRLVGRSLERASGRVGGPGGRSDGRPLRRWVERSGGRMLGRLVGRSGGRSGGGSGGQADGRGAVVWRAGGRSDGRRSGSAVGWPDSSFEGGLRLNRQFGLLRHSTSSVAA